MARISGITGPLKRLSWKGGPCRIYIVSTRSLTCNTYVTARSSYHLECALQTSNSGTLSSSIATMNTKLAAFVLMAAPVTATNSLLVEENEADANYTALMERQEYRPAFTTYLGYNCQGGILVDYFHTIPGETCVNTPKVWPPCFRSHRYRSLNRHFGSKVNASLQRRCRGFPR